MNVKKWKNNKFIENLKIKQYPAYPAEFIVFLCVTLFRQKMAEKRYTICILLHSDWFNIIDTSTNLKIHQIVVISFLPNI